MKNIKKTLGIISLTVAMTMSNAMPIFAAGSKKAGTTAEPVVIGDNNTESRSGSSSISNKYVGSMYYQSSFYDDETTDPFTLESDYTKGMDEEEEDSYYQQIHLSVYEDADRTIISPKWERVSETVVDYIEELNENKITYLEAVQKTIALDNKSVDISTVKSDLVKTMFKNYADTLSDKGIAQKEFNLDDYTMLTEVDDLILYDDSGKEVHGSNIKATLTNSLISGNIDPDRLFVLHYNTKLESWELIPTTNVDTENHTADVVFNNLSPFTLLYLNKDESNETTTTTTTDDQCCNHWYCKLLKNKCCGILCIGSHCWCWIILVIIVLILIMLIALIVKEIHDFAKKKNDDDDDSSSDDDFII